MSKKSIETRNNILNSGRINFLKTGFSGTSMSQIAKDAGVTKALLFHYFNTKEELWKQVKDDILGVETIQHFNTLHMDTFEEFIDSMLTLRFELYANNVDLIKMMTWQRCDLNNASIKDTQTLPPSLWKNIFEKFQEKGEISQRINLTMLKDLIFNLSSMPFLENAEWIHDKKQQETYKNMIKKMIIAFAKEE